MGAVKVKATDFDVLEDLVLVVLTDEFENNDDEFVDLERLKERIPRFGANPIREAIRGLDARGHLVYRTEMRPSGPLVIGPHDRQVRLESYRVTRTGIQAATSLETDYRNSLWSELVAQTEGSEAETKSDDDHWEPLPIDRSTPEYREMTAATERAIDRIEGDNGYAANQPEERSAVLGALKSALSALKEGWASTAIIRVSLLAPLRFIAEKFFGSGIGEAAKKAVEAVSKWLIG